MRSHFLLSSICLWTACTHTPGPNLERSFPVIDNDGIGPVRLGHALAPERLDPKRYRLQYFADAQPLEGFLIGEPPVFAAFDDGPFERWLNETGQFGPPPASSRFSAQAITHAQNGAPVIMVYTAHPGAATIQGIQVGSKFTALKTAYPNTKVEHMPPLFEDPTCVATTSALPRLWFFLADCAHPEESHIHRIAVW